MTSHVETSEQQIVFRWAAANMVELCEGVVCFHFCIKTCRKKNIGLLIVFRHAALLLVL